MEVGSKEPFVKRGNVSVATKSQSSKRSNVLSFAQTEADSFGEQACEGVEGEEGEEGRGEEKEKGKG